MRRSTALGVGALVVIGAGVALALWRGPDRGRGPAGPIQAGPAAAEGRAELAEAGGPVLQSARTSLALEKEPEASEPPPVAGEERASGSVLVRFVDERGAPIAGVELCSSSDRARTCTSGPDGGATFELGTALRTALRTALGAAGPGARLTLEARCPGYAAARRSALAKPGERLLLGDWVLVAGGSVEGTVVGSDGLGLGRIRVGCLGIPYVPGEWEREQRGAFETLWRPGAQAVTGRDGAFRLDAVPAGTICLVAVAEDRPASVSGPVEVPAGGLATGVRIEMAAADGGTGVAGIVLDPAGAPVAGAPVEIRSAGSRYNLSTDAEGRFELPLESKKPRDLTARDPAGRHRPAVLLGVLPGSPALELRLLPAPEIELRVRSADGAPIERFAVALVPPERDARAPDLGRFAAEDRRGGVLRFGAPAQDFVVEVRANGWQGARLGPFSVDAPPSRLDCPLDPAAGLRGTVTAGGVPLAGASLTLHPAVKKNDTHNGFPLRMHPSPAASTTSDGRGEFVLSVEEEGTYFLLAEAEGHALAELGPLALTPAREQRERIELDAGGTLAVRVRADDPRAAAGVLVAFSRGDGCAFTERTDEAGEAWIPLLTPGPWQVELAQSEIDPGSGATRFGLKSAGPIPSNCRVFAGEVTRVDLWLEGEGEDDGACRLAGRLTLDGKPAEGWRASLDQERAPSSEERSFHEAGAFRLAVEQPGSYRLRLVTETGDPAAMLVLLDPVELFEGEQHWSLELATGVLAGTLPAGAGDALHLYRWRRGALQVFAPLVPDAAGRFRCPRAPAGRGQLVRADANQPLEAQDPSVLRELEIVAGQVNEVDL